MIKSLTMSCFLINPTVILRHRFLTTCVPGEVVLDYNNSLVFGYRPRSAKLYDTVMTKITECRHHLLHAVVSHQHDKAHVLHLKEGVCLQPFPSIADKLRWLMQNHKKPDGSPCTVEDIAAQTSLSKTYLYQLLRGEKQNPTIDTLEELAAFFDVTPSFFFKRPEHFTPPVTQTTIQNALRNLSDLCPEARKTLDQFLPKTTKPE